jgi:DNA repair exonuclease SbcCD nuclease subunit
MKRRADDRGSMKLLLVSDVHLDTPFTWAEPQVARARRMAIRSTLRRALAVAEEQQVDAFLVAGDLYEHDRFAPDTAEFLRESFGSVGMPVYLAPGNHDWYGPQSIYHQADWSPNVHVFDEDRLTPAELVDGFTIWGAAHRAPANTDGFLENFTVDRSGFNLGLFHGSEQGDFAWQESGKFPHAPFRVEQIAQSRLDHALVGHFHQPIDGQWHTYPGNPDPLTFGESGERAAVLVEVDDDGVLKRTRINVAQTEVHDVTVDLTGVTNSSEARDRVSTALQGLHGVVRATLTGEIGPAADVRVRDLGDLGSHLQAFVPRLGHVTVAYDFDALAQEQTVRGQFMRDVLEADLDDDVRRRVLITGLRALDGRGDDLEVH